jgi:hypothetical protein
MDRLTLLVLASLLASCGSDSATAPENFPDVRGTYTGGVVTEFTAAAGDTARMSCAVTVNVTDQRSHSFTGTLARTSPCTTATRVVGGSVDEAGNVQFGFDVPGSFQGFDGCRYLSGDQWWRGQLQGNQLSLTMDATLDCEGRGSTQGHGSLSARRP